MAPVSRFLAAGFLLVSLAASSPLPQIAHAGSVMNAINHLQGEIKDDPHKVTDTWGKNNKGKKGDCKKKRSASSSESGKDKDKKDKGKDGDDDDC